MNDTVVIDSINYSTEAIKYVTLDHKTSLKCQLFWIKIYTYICINIHLKAE